MEEQVATLAAELAALKELTAGLNRTTAETFYFLTALLHKPGDGQTYPFPGQTYPSTPVMGVPRAVKPLSTATLTWTSAT